MLLFLASIIFIFHLADLKGNLFIQYLNSIIYTQVLFLLCKNNINNTQLFPRNIPRPLSELFRTNKAATTITYNIYIIYN